MDMEQDREVVSKPEEPEMVDVVGVMVLGSTMALLGKSPAAVEWTFPASGLFSQCCQCCQQQRGISAD